MQENYARVTGQDLPTDGKGIYLLGEKILSGDEALREDWPIHGTTGYDFTTHVTQLLVDPAAEKSFSETYQKFINRHVNFPALVYEKKRLTMRLSLANDINVLGFILNRLSERNRLFRDFTLNDLTNTVREVIACFPVYRTYLFHGQHPSAADRAVVNKAVTLARRRNPGTDASIFDFLRDILLFKFPPNTDEAGTAEHEHFVMKFQQCTGPIMAKRFGRHGVLHLQPARRAQRGRRRAAALRQHAGKIPPHQRAQRPTLAAHDAGQLHARHQARRGYPRAGRRAL